MTAKAKRAAWLAWVTLPLVLFVLGGAVSLLVGLVGATLAGFAWATGAKALAAAIMVVAGLPLGLLVAIAAMYWTDQRKARLRQVGL